MQQLYDFLYKPPTKLMLLTGCSPVTTVIAEAAPVWKLVVVRYNTFLRIPDPQIINSSYHTVEALLHFPIEIDSQHCSGLTRQRICRTPRGKLAIMSSLTYFKI